MDKVGLIGTNVQPLLDESRAAFEKGDNAIARSRAAQLIETLDGRRSVGQSRVLRTSLGVGGFLFLLIVLVVLRRRTKRRRRLAEQIQTEQTLVTGPEPALVTGPEPGLRGENWPAPQP